ncbi:hypothetical protein KIK84_07465 [Curvibacter sp. CHRR-16]|uniref:hypothetical protein n=1 Tax=Curvibacter sp. CHRR-16 TaxID=2835872 RepID=UPI001BDB0C6D|nr:hypothetical protein [Curvibacter sp. CHRR-16]MBT0570158.1 hypothetical protein [Curvibacter sp. CHRR-16]
MTGKSLSELPIDASNFPFAVNDQVQHLKSGGLYTIVAFARLEADLTICCVYQHQETGLVWVRGIDEMFDGRFARVAR